MTGTDQASLPYQRWVHGIYRATRPRVPFAFAGGHEHSLQVHRDALGAYYLVSGAGSASKVDRVEKTDTSMLSAARPGYMRIDVRSDASIEVFVQAVDRDGSREELLRHCLVEGPPRPWRRPPERQRPGE